MKCRHCGLGVFNVENVWFHMEHEGETCGSLSPDTVAAPRMTLNEALEAVAVHDPSQWENDDGPKGWFAVSTDGAGGIVAYFRDEEAALHYRLTLINQKLNQGWDGGNIEYIPGKKS